MFELIFGTLFLYIFSVLDVWIYVFSLGLSLSGFIQSYKETITTFYDIIVQLDKQCNVWVVLALTWWIFMIIPSCSMKPAACRQSCENS